MTEMIFGVAGGLALFIFGMNLMGEGLKKAAGEKLRIILEKITKNPLIGILVGTIITALIQSSSATTVMAISFVNARLMSLPQAIAIIMGANIGTTITAQLVAFDIGAYAYLIAAVGFGFYFFPKRKNIQYFGQIFFGFGLLFIGLNTMSSLLRPLADSPLISEAIIKFSQIPFLGIIVGTISTLVIQSSSAVIGILQTLASQPVEVNGTIQPLVPLAAAVPILLGSNIGTTITAILASIGANKSAKRAAAAHSVFNVLGCLVCIIFLNVFIKFVLMMPPHLEAGQLATDIIKRQIANAHFWFNLFNTLLLLPFIKHLSNLVTKIVPGEDPYVERTTKYLNTHITNNPSLALDLSAKELTRMGECSLEMFALVKDSFQNSNLSQKSIINDHEDNIDFLQAEIIKYLSTVTSNSVLTQHEAQRLADLMHIVGDIERIGDHCMNIFEIAEYKLSSGETFSDSANEEIEAVFNLTNEMITNALKALYETDFSAARKVLELEMSMDSTEENLRLSHIGRLNQGLCNPNAAVCFCDLLTNLERMADHCCNIAEAVLDEERKKQFLI